MTYGSFDYTSLLYLSDYLDDFGGGRFVFMEEGANKTVEPRAGRTRRWWPWGCGAGFKGAMLHLWSACCMSGGQQLPGSTRDTQEAHSSEGEAGLTVVTHCITAERVPRAWPMPCVQVVPPPSPAVGPCSVPSQRDSAASDEVMLPT